MQEAQITQNTWGDELTEHKFGGIWTAQKLDVLQRYLEFFTTALKQQPYELVYIDTFAGAGRCTISVGDSGETTIDGSASIALNNSIPFQSYFFIERKKKHIKALEQLKSTHPLGDRVTITHGDAQTELAGILSGRDWKKTRGVLFLDPYGLQCSWDMVQSTAATKALDVFFLVSLSGLTRQAPTDYSRLDESKESALTRFLGTSDWKSAWYQPPAMGDLFGGGPELVRDPGTDGILQFVQNRMSTVFPKVEEPVILRNKQNAALFALFFAVSNDSPAAIGLASKVARNILSKLQ